MSKAKTITEAGTDIGTLLVIDPCLLFTTEEWDNIPLKSDDTILMAVAAKVDEAGHQGARHFGLIDTGGDGPFMVGLLPAAAIRAAREAIRKGRAVAAALLSASNGLAVAQDGGELAPALDALYDWEEGSLAPLEGLGEGKS
jgi:hypothetical protein